MKANTMAWRAMALSVLFIGCVTAALIADLCPEFTARGIDCPTKYTAKAPCWALLESECEWEEEFPRVNVQVVFHNWECVQQGNSYSNCADGVDEDNNPIDEICYTYDTCEWKIGAGGWGYCDTASSEEVYRILKVNIPCKVILEALP